MGITTKVVFSALVFNFLFYFLSKLFRTILVVGRYLSGLLVVLFRLPVKKRVFGTCRNGYGINLSAARQYVEPLGSKPGREHDAGVKSQIGGCGTSRPESNAHIGAVYCAGNVGVFAGTCVKSAMAAIEALRVRLCAYNDYTFGLANIVGITQKEFHAMLLYHVGHEVRDDFQVVAVDERDFDNIHALAFGCSACGGHHLTSRREYMLVAALSFVYNHCCSEVAVIR